MEIHGIKFTDDDVVNPDDFGAWNKPRVFIFHDHGFVLGVVIQPNLQDAFDELADSGKIDHLMLGDEVVTFDEANQCDIGPDGEQLTRLGNAGETFDVETVGFIEVEEPAFSLVGLLEVAQRNNGD